MATRVGIAKLFRTILEYYPGTHMDVDEGAQNRWGAVLRDVPDQELLRALVAYVRAGERFAPRPGELLAHCEIPALPPASWLHEWSQSDAGRAAAQLARTCYPEAYQGVREET